jgi:hypothetical protein
MKLPFPVLIVVPAALLFTASSVLADSTIRPASSLVWSSNVGWTNWLPSLPDGVVTGEYVCSGYLYGANVGWINMGNGAPQNHIRYSNTSGVDSGVNLLPGGLLRGLAWGANIGWVNFEDIGNARLDPRTGKITGYAYSANTGWINLDDGADHFLTTRAIPSGVDTDGDGIPDAWEYEHTGGLTTLTLNGDADGDGIPDVSEYLADTDPLLPDYLRIVDYQFRSGELRTSLTWTSRPTRFYRVQSSTDLTNWTLDQDNIPPDAGATTATTVPLPPGPRRFYRVSVFRPLGG